MKPDFDKIDNHTSKTRSINNHCLLHGSKPVNTYIEYTTVYISWSGDNRSCIGCETQNWWTVGLGLWIDIVMPELYISILHLFNWPDVLFSIALVGRTCLGVRHCWPLLLLDLWFGHFYVCFSKNYEMEKGAGVHDFMISAYNQWQQHYILYLGVSLYP
jgi:hypothetical protein